MKKPFNLRLSVVLGRLAVSPFSHRIDSRVTRAFSRLAACVLVGALAAGIWSVGEPHWFWGRARAAGASPGLSLSSTSLATYPSATFAVDIVADCGLHADAVSTAVTFNPAYLQVVALTPDVSRFPNPLRKRYDNGVGSVEYDAGADLFCHEDGNCPSGTARVATITFRAVGASGSSVPLHLQGQMTWEGEYIFDGEGNGSTVAITIAGDLDADCDVDIVDIMLVAARWSSALGQPQYDARYDLDADGDIDIVDIMIVASRWNQKCSGGASLAKEVHG
jgi:hypothetical protein